MTEHDSQHMARVPEAEDRAEHQEEVEAARVGREAPAQEDEAPDPAAGPLAGRGEGENTSLLQTDLGEILEERKNYRPDPEVREALQGLRDIPVREALDET